MRHAEHLYLDGHLSYPRTETNKFPPSFDVEGALRQQAGDERWGAYARRLLDEFGGPPTGGRRPRAFVDTDADRLRAPLRALDAVPLVLRQRIPRGCRPERKIFIYQ